MTLKARAIRWVVVAPLCEPRNVIIAATRLLSLMSFRIGVVQIAALAKPNVEHV